MKMTKIAIVAAVCGLMVGGMGTTQAQGAKGKRAQAVRAKALKQAGGKHQGGLAELLEKLNLTPDQKKQVATIEEGAKKQAMTIAQNASLTPADKKMQEKALGKDTRKQIAAILTPDQKKQLKELVAERRAAKAAKGATAPGAAPSATPPASPAPKTGSIILTEIGRIA